MNEIDYLRQACQFASISSRDSRTQNGAVLVTKTRVICAVNAFPSGVTVTDERRAAPEKYLFIEHAERAAIYRAASLGVATAGSTLYCPWFACCDCARAIIMSGVTEVDGRRTSRRLRRCSPRPASASGSWQSSWANGCVLMGSYANADWTLRAGWGW